MTCNA